MDDLKIRQKCEEMIAYGYVVIRQLWFVDKADLTDGVGAEHGVTA